MSRLISYYVLLLKYLILLYLELIGLRNFFYILKRMKLLYLLVYMELKKFLWIYNWFVLEIFIDSCLLMLFEILVFSINCL